MPLIHASTIEAFGRRWKHIWLEDDATRNDPSAEHLQQAWERLFGEKYPGSKTAPEEDHGDTFYYEFGDRMYVMACDGDSIYVPVKCSTCWDSGWLCGECGKPECECARSYYRAPPYPCECPAGQVEEAKALATRRPGAPVTHGGADR